MKLLVDCTPLSGGGGVQVAIAFLDALVKQTSVQWMATAPDSIAAMLPEHLTADPSRWLFLRKRSWLDIPRISFILRRSERLFSPDAVFTVFGPAYFKAESPHLVGFALPRMIDDSFTSSKRAAKSFASIGNETRKLLLRQADHIVVETETVRSRLSHRISYPARRISVVGNAINPLLEGLAVKTVSKSVSFRILIPSAYYKHKNLEIVPAVAAALERLLPHLPFEFCLTLDEASLPWRAIAREADARRVGARVITLGRLNLAQLAAAYNMSAAVFLPTQLEASTAVYPESFYFRRPVVTSDLDFARELCGEAALFAAPHDAEALAVQLASLARYPELADRLVNLGCQRLEACYPTPESKFAQQIGLLTEMVRLNRTGIAGGSHS